MARPYLVVVDMQKDFVTGALGTPEARAIVGRVAALAREFEGEVLFTMDTHGADYLETQEGRRLPVTHCVRGTDGWQLVEELDEVRRERDARVFEKPAFGSPELARWLAARGDVASLEFAGVCTDICVVSNALLAKAFLPEVPVSVDASCCAGVTPEVHEAALQTMRSCQVEVTGA